MVTAHHGTGLRRCLDKYLAYLATAEGRAPLLVWFDDFLIDAAPDLLAKVLGDPETPLEGRQLSSIYSLPRRTLQALWRRAIMEAWPVVLDGLRSGQTVIFACNASIYHEQSGAISPAVNDAALIERILDTRHTDPHLVETLRQALSITVIDDIFDCFVRLADRGDVFDPSSVWPEVPTRATALRAILDWRQHEVLNAERIARLLGWRHVIFPSKHAISTFHKVVEGYPIAYFSHPLRQVRLAEGDQWSGERELINELYDGLQHRAHAGRPRPLGNR